jgi:ATP-dependent protease ClpP protease subunit
MSAEEAREYGLIDDVVQQHDLSANPAVTALN